MSSFRYPIIFLLLSCSLLLTSCASKFPTFHQLAQLPDEKMCRVAVLPFSNESGFAEGNVIFYRIFMAELTALDSFELVQEGDIRRAYRQIKLLPFVQEPNLVQMQVIGNYLNLQYLVLGKIIAMGVSKTEGQETPFLTVETRLVDAASGKTLWTSYHTRKGDEFRKVMHFGVINSVTRLSRVVSQEILARWQSEGFKAQCLE